MPAPTASAALEALMAAPEVYTLTPEKESLFLSAMREAVEIPLIVARARESERQALVDYISSAG